MWVPKVPRRPDFCGCPPCPLCYDWADENKEVMQGFLKFCLDMLGRTLEDALSRLPTPELRDQFEKQMRELADRVHQDKVDAAKTDPFKVNFEKRALEIQLRANAVIKEREKKLTRPARKKTVLLDNLELNKVPTPAPAKKQPRPQPPVFIDENDFSGNDVIQRLVKEFRENSDFRDPEMAVRVAEERMKVIENQLSRQLSPAMREKMMYGMQRSMEREFNNRRMRVMAQFMGGNPNFTYKRYQK
jgi:hypothetical protein